MSEQDAKNLRRSAHKLNGSLRFLKLLVALHASEKIERDARAGELEGVDSWYAELRSIVAAFVEQLPENVRERYLI